MVHPVVPEWTGDLAQLQEIQAALAQQVIIRDDFPRPVRSVAGFHVRSWPDDADDGDEGFVEAAVVLLDADTLQTIATGVHRERARMIGVFGAALKAVADGVATAADHTLIEQLGKPHIPHAACVRAFERLWQADEATARRAYDLCRVYGFAEPGLAPPLL